LCGGNFPQYEGPLRIKKGKRPGEKGKNRLRPKKPPSPSYPPKKKGDPNPLERRALPKRITFPNQATKDWQKALPQIGKKWSDQPPSLKRGPFNYQIEKD